MDDNRRSARAIVIVVSLALAAIWLIPGSRVIENRRTVQFPDPSLTGVASAADFRTVDAALLDRLPVKGTVVRALSAGLVGAGLSPTDLVFRGSTGEPFVSTDFTYSCFTRSQVEAVDTISRYVRAVLSDKGIDFLYAIAPDKSSIDRDGLGPAGPLIMRCADTNRQILQAFADQPDSPLLVGWDELSAAPERVYQFRDSHWNQQGAALFAGLLVNRLSSDGVAPPGAWEADDVVDGYTFKHKDDLFGFMGLVDYNDMVQMVSERPGVATTRVDEKHDGVTTHRWVSTGPGLIEGRTLVLHDSFFLVNGDMLAPYFADLTALPLTAIGTPGDLATIDGYDHVIVLQVQRFVPSFIGDIPTADWITTGR
jgi:hypothetical protein